MFFYQLGFGFLILLLTCVYLLIWKSKIHVLRISFPAEKEATRMMKPMMGCRAAESAGTELPIGGESGPKVVGKPEAGSLVFDTEGGDI